MKIAKSFKSLALQSLSKAHKTALNSVF